MARPLRFQYEDAMYHVINRGNYRAWIFQGDGAKLSFQETLFEACQRSEWNLLAYCIMDNHYHLALQTPKANLSEGMRWLGTTFGVRFNRFRKESGHIFQGRYKSIVIEDGDRMASLCHYIHLNPVRARIVAPDRLRHYRWSSLPYLWQKRDRPKQLDLDCCLEGAGGLRDTPAGRDKYAEYLRWLAEDEPSQKAMLFDQMSKGWAIGSRQFKKELIQGAEKERGRLGSERGPHQEAAELLWEDLLENCLLALQKNRAQAAQDRKFSDWKVAISAWMKLNTLCSNAWLSRQLKMGSESGVSRFASETILAKRNEAARLLKTLQANMQ